MTVRTHQFKMMLSDDEVRTLRALAEKQGLDVSNYLRQVIREKMKEHNAAAMTLRIPPHCYVCGQDETVDPLSYCEYPLGCERKMCGKHAHFQGLLQVCFCKEHEEKYLALRRN